MMSPSPAAMPTEPRVVRLRKARRLKSCTADPHGRCRFIMIPGPGVLEGWWRHADRDRSRDGVTEQQPKQLADSSSMQAILLSRHGNHNNCNGHCSTIVRFVNFFRTDRESGRRDKPDGAGPVYLSRPGFAADQAPRKLWPPCFRESVDQTSGNRRGGTDGINQDGQ